MATFVEADVIASIEIREVQGTVRIFAEAVSVTASGEKVRRASMDITDSVSQARRDGAAALLADVEAYAKSQWSIS